MRNALAGAAPRNLPWIKTNTLVDKSKDSLSSGTSKRRQKAPLCIAIPDKRLLHAHPLQ
jgi:hypothetical protein